MMIWIWLACTTPKEKTETFQFEVNDNTAVITGDLDSNSPEQVETLLSEYGLITSD